MKCYICEEEVSFMDGAKMNESENNITRTFIVHRDCLERRLYEKYQKEEGEIFFKMKIHESIKTCNGDWIATRVPGGWIYRHHAGEIAVFVPLNSEFAFQG